MLSSKTVSTLFECCVVAGGGECVGLSEQRQCFRLDASEFSRCNGKLNKNGKQQIKRIHVNAIYVCCVAGSRVGDDHHRQPAEATDEKMHGCTAVGKRAKL